MKQRKNNVAISITFGSQTAPKQPVHAFFLVTTLVSTLLGVRTSLAMLPILWAKSLAALVRAACKTQGWLHGGRTCLFQKERLEAEKFGSSKSSIKHSQSPNPSRTRWPWSLMELTTSWWYQVIFHPWICNHKKLNWHFCGYFLRSQLYAPRTYLTQRLETEQSLISSWLDVPPKDCHIQMQGGSIRAPTHFPPKIHTGFGMEGIWICGTSKIPHGAMVADDHLEPSNKA